MSDAAGQTYLCGVSLGGYVSLEMLTPAERRWAEVCGFDGAPHSHVLLADAKGNIVRVLAGVRDANDPWALAGLPLKLPRGRYEVARGGVPIAADKAAFAWDLGGYQFTSPP